MVAALPKRRVTAASCHCIFLAHSAVPGCHTAPTLTRMVRSAIFAATCTAVFGTVVFLVHRIQQDERQVRHRPASRRAFDIESQPQSCPQHIFSPSCAVRLLLDHAADAAPPQLMRKGVLNDLERQTRAIERKTREAQAANSKGEP
jgi:hypothetical protein